MLRWFAGASTVAPAPPPPTHALPPAHSLVLRRAARRNRLHRLFRSCSAKKPAKGDRAESSVLSKSLLLRSGVALFALGFVDAGYSGDWSRIGAISKDTEELLKLGAYVVVPLSLALIFSVPEDSNNDQS